MNDFRLSRLPNPGMAYDTPACDVHCGIGIRVLITTGCTSKPVPGAVAPRLAARTNPAGIRRVDQLNGDSVSRGFVRNERLQFSERPTGHHPIEMFVPSARLEPNARELFH